MVSIRHVNRKFSCLFSIEALIFSPLIIVSSLQEDFLI